MLITNVPNDQLSTQDFTMNDGDVPALKEGRVLLSTLAFYIGAFRDTCTHLHISLNELLEFFKELVSELRYRGVLLMLVRDQQNLMWSCPEWGYASLLSLFLSKKHYSNRAI